VPNPLLIADRVSVTFGHGRARSAAVREVSVRLEPGQITLLMGASGSGKTTLLSVLGCLRKPDSGHLTILGRNLEHARDRELVAMRRSHIGFVFQFFRLFRSLTALENVVIGKEISADPRTPREAGENALAAVGLHAKRFLLPEEMSGGERQRVAIARAMVKKPEILLADEPTAALDSASGAEVADLIRRSVKSSGMAAVLATHDPRLAGIADRILEIRDGRLLEERK